MCNHDCNQGRNCNCKKQKGFTGVEIAIFIMAAASIFTYVIPLFASTDPVCRAGFLYDSVSGAQIMSVEGGGIKCVVKNE